ncbi:MAG: hypothetical protein EKK42_28600 [Pseudonocardiaceae bacterium]|nr:MAG: hypothetical protein EKK42_28600 [Pseudonocardiaceae bacterium]
MLAFDDMQLLDVTGPAEVFATADTIAGGDAYARPWSGRRRTRRPCAGQSPTAEPRSDLHP